MEYTMSDLMQMPEAELDRIMRELIIENEILDQQLAQQQEVHVLAETLKKAENSGFFDGASLSIPKNRNSQEMAIPCVIPGGDRP